MNGLVDQLQEDALNQDVPVSTLLRKVKVTAVKLGLDEVLTWVESELSGYRSELPDYRQGRGQTNGWNPHHGWQPIHFGDPAFGDLVATVNFVEPVANYEALLDKGEGPFQMPLSMELVALLNETLSIQVPRVVNNIARGTIVQIVQRVRDMVLDWALELARAGVTGEGIRFSNDERERATGAHISIGTFHGSFNSGDAVGANPRINQGSSDHSTNAASENSVFGNIEQAVRAEVDDPVVKAKLCAANDAMRTAKDSSSFLAAYNRFVGAAADHMTVIGPYLPALTALISTHIT
jgi:hypothetical protein